jgi:hypothetical protein
MWRNIRKATDGKWTVRMASIAQLFGNERCTATTLALWYTLCIGTVYLIQAPTKKIYSVGPICIDFVYAVTGMVVGKG